MRLNVRWAAALAAGLVAVPTAAHAKPVSPEQFGLHVASLGAGATPSVSVKSVRLWDAGVRWDEINPQKGQYNWAPLDRAVSAAEAAGATEILYVLGSTMSDVGRALEDAAAPRPSPGLRAAESGFRSFGLGAQVLRHIGLRRIEVITDNPRKIIGVSGFGIEVVGSTPIEGA